jgi:hypothetical protein
MREKGGVLEVNLAEVEVDPTALPDPPLPPDPVKKFRDWEIGNPYHVQGRGKFTPPKKALGSPLPADN